MFRIAVVVLALLHSGIASAGRIDPPQCKSVPACVALAEKTPGQFTKELSDQLLRQLSGAALVDGLKFKHPKPQVNELIQRQIREALKVRDGHTRTSAEALLRLAQAESPDDEEEEEDQRWWLNLLSLDREGRAALVRFIDHGEKTAFRLRAMVAYVSYAGYPTLSERAPPTSPGIFDANPPINIPPDVQPVVDRYVDEIWSTYLAHRRKEQDPEGEMLRRHMQRRREYVDRLVGLVRAQIEAGEVPSWTEMSTLGEMVDLAPQVARTLLRWAQSSNRPVARLAADSLVSRSYPAMFTPEELRDVRKVMITCALDPKDEAQVTHLFVLTMHLEGVSAEDAKEVARVAQQPPLRDERGRNRYRDELLFGIAEPYPEYREPLIQRLSESDLPAVDSLTAFHTPPPPWASAFAAAWVRDRTADELRNEDVQERFLFLARLLSADIRGRLELPNTRRAHMDGWHEIPAAPPMTAPEAAARWQKFVLARERVVRHLEQRTK